MVISKKEKVEEVSVEGLAGCVWWSDAGSTCAQVSHHQVGLTLTSNTDERDVVIALQFGGAAHSGLPLQLLLLYVWSTFDLIRKILHFSPTGLNRVMIDESKIFFS